ncbi:hypothetical protein BJ166DRAFT_496965 [Pestalotiopsis sp. NC0098]|nr:hypothetical protein BJ166DRAFT_496965 [Pestalotiopsis sp. NC0098]
MPSRRSKAGRAADRAAQQAAAYAAEQAAAAYAAAQRDAETQQAAEQLCFFLDYQDEEAELERVAAERAYANLEAAGQLDYFHGLRREQHQQEPQHAAQVARLDDDVEYNKLFSTLEAIYKGVPGFTVDDLPYPDGNKIENAISYEMHCWQRHPHILREYAMVLCWVRHYHGMVDYLEEEPDLSEQLAHTILYSDVLGQATGEKIFAPLRILVIELWTDCIAAPSLRHTVFEFMIHEAVLNVGLEPYAIFDHMIAIEPEVVTEINAGFDSFLDRRMKRNEEKMAYRTDGDDYGAMIGLTDIASTLWKEGLYTSPYAFVLILRVCLETTVTVERPLLEDAKKILIEHSGDLREIITRGDLIWENLDPLERDRLVFGPDVAVSDHLPGSPGGLDEGRWAYWRRAIISMIQRPRDNGDFGEARAAMMAAESRFPRRRDLIPQPIARMPQQDLQRSRRY